MSKIEVKNVEGKAAGEVELSDSVFGITPNIPVMHQVVVAYEASMRQGTHSTKNRSSVSGGGANPTARRAPAAPARASVPRSGSAVASSLAPLRVAMPSASTTRRRSSPCAPRFPASLPTPSSSWSTSFYFKEPKTKLAVAALKALGIEGKRVTIVVADDDVITYLAFRNLPKVSIIAASEANTRNLVDNGALVMSTAVAKQLEEVLAPMNSAYEVIIRPIVSERSFDLMADGKYTFEVALSPQGESAAAVGRSSTFTSSR